ncbi:hypothetical protein L6R46_21995 [Myxococcota bacterium]|nr:hypothetical protein [Myxococcota bacterium]
MSDARFATEILVSDDGRRAFRVPRGFAPSSGVVGLRGLDGPLSASEEDLAGLELPVAEALAEVNERLEEGYEEARALGGHLMKLARLAAALRRPEVEERLGEATRASEDAARRVREALGAEVNDQARPETRPDARPDELLGEAAREIGQRLRGLFQSSEVTDALSTLGARLQDLAGSLQDEARRRSEPQKSRDEEG